MVFVTEICEHKNVNFGKILQIFVSNNNIYLSMQPFGSIYFDEHVYAYCVQQYTTFILKSVNELPEIHPCIMMTKNENVFIASKYTL